MKFPSLYFNWLQKDNPTGEVDLLPELHDRFETSVPGVYCIGDLTGIPLVKLAADSGREIIERLRDDAGFQNERSHNSDPGILDLVIIGAGPSGVSAAIHAQEMGLRFIVLESSRLFNTIVNYPARKPIYVTPAGTPFKSSLQFSDGTKESLLEELRAAVHGKELPVSEGEMVEYISRESAVITVKSLKRSYRALRVIVAIGKTGNARMPGIAGERLPKVFTRLVDPGEHTGKDILVVGGGDSALEAAIALARSQNRVTLSYRKAAFSRPKEQNILAFNRMVKEKKITPVFESTVSQIRENEVVLKTGGREKTIRNDVVYALIGNEIPVAFFKRSKIRMAGEKTFGGWMQMAALLLFSSVLYFGKKAPSMRLDSMARFLTLPSKLPAVKWTYALSGFAAWASMLLMTVGGVYLAVHFIANRKRYFTSAWKSFKYAYYASMFVLFGFLYLSRTTGGSGLFGYGMGFWYTAMYSLTIVVFGLRRMHVNPTGYIKRQTWLLMAIQVIPLFILPALVFPWMGKAGLFNGWIMRNVFPNGSYWRGYGFILAWPLFIHILASGQPYIFWLVAGCVQTFVLIPWINYVWGKGAYCGWICSCGALAETLGDEYRTLAPHGPAAKKADNIGQVVLWFAGFVSALLILKAWVEFDWEHTVFFRDIYDILVDVFFAGVLGVGVYFFMSGRVWCRFLCPLAALMHIYTRFSKYRIMSNKKRCISCGICTGVCHMGIDVMGYANRGVPMNDVECVRCSACIVSCPMQVLTFGDVGGVDLNNTAYRKGHIPLKRGWESGLMKKDIDMLLADEAEMHPETGARQE